jgi:dTDP-glucose pyrophosphorylase
VRHDVAKITVGLGATLRETIAAIDRGELGLALLVDDAGRLRGTVTDGDVRRAMLSGLELDSAVEALLERRRHDPLTAPPGVTASELLELMSRHVVRQVPLVDEDGKPVDVAMVEDLVEDTALPLRAVVMAGGFGKRLGALTETMPKPMLPVGGRPLLERIIVQLRAVGIDRVHVTTHYRPEEIVDHFQDGSRFGIQIEYLNEEQPLGTAGALGLMDTSDDRPILVLNGDIVTDADFRALLHFHIEHEADMTIGVWPYEIKVPYGIIETEGEVVTAIREKPIVRAFANAGIYLIDPGVCRSIPPGEHLDMTDLIDRALAEGRRVISFPLREYWLDIGELETYERALLDAAARGAT